MAAAIGAYTGFNGAWQVPVDHQVGTVEVIVVHASAGVGQADFTVLCCSYAQTLKLMQDHRYYTGSGSARAALAFPTFDFNCKPVAVQSVACKGDAIVV